MNDTPSPDLRTSEPIRFFLPGPTYVSKPVLRAMDRQPIGHRSAEFKTLYQSVTERLQKVFRTERPVLPITSSGSLSWDIAAASTMRGKVLCCVNGAFSSRFSTVCKARGLEVVDLQVEWGHPVDPEAVREALAAGGFEAVTVAHNETSTGVLSDIESIARVVREASDALFYVDAVSSMAGARVEMDAWGIDYLFTGAQKALALPPGMAFVSFSERLEDKARATEHRGYYTDLLAWLGKHEGGSTLTTPSVSLVYAADVQLDAILAEGMEARWQRHAALRERTEAWAADTGFTYYSAPEGASPTVSCLRPAAEGPTGPAELVAALAEEGITLGGGYGKLKAETIRIGHMGEVRLSDLDGLLSAIDSVLSAGGAA